MAALSHDEVTQLALLARLRLSDAESLRIGADLSKILGYVAKLEALDTTGVEPMTHAVPMDCPLRPDRAGESLLQDTALGMTAGRDGEFFEVPRIITAGTD